MAAAAGDICSGKGESCRAEGNPLHGFFSPIVRNQLTAVSTYLSIGAGNTSGGSSATPASTEPWANITY